MVDFSTLSVTLLVAISFSIRRIYDQWFDKRKTWRSAPSTLSSLTTSYVNVATFNRNNEIVRNYRTTQVRWWLPGLWILHSHTIITKYTRRNFPQQLHLSNGYSRYISRDHAVIYVLDERCRVCWTTDVGEVNRSS